MSSKRRLRRNACTGKQRHETIESAQGHSRRTGHGKAYRCKFCQGFHIGGPKGRSLAKAFRKAQAQGGQV